MKERETMKHRSPLKLSIATTTPTFPSSENNFGRTDTSLATYWSGKNITVRLPFQAEYVNTDTMSG